MGIGVYPGGGSNGRVLVTGDIKDGVGVGVLFYVLLMLNMAKFLTKHVSLKGFSLNLHIYIYIYYVVKCIHPETNQLPSKHCRQQHVCTFVCFCFLVVF